MQLDLSLLKSLPITMRGHVVNQPNIYSHRKEKKKHAYLPLSCIFLGFRLVIVPLDIGV